MSIPLFSVLIPCVPRRYEQAFALFNKIQTQVDAEDCPCDVTEVEILCLMDNKRRSIGLKREALVQAARGKWLAFVDDDDDVAPNYMREIMAAINMDDIEVSLGFPVSQVIVFDQLAEIEGKSHIVEHSILNENTELGELGALRKPWHHNVWKSEFAKTAHFPDISYGEDSEWLKQLWPRVTMERRIPMILHHYRWSAQVSEADNTQPNSILVTDAEGME